MLSMMFRLFKPIKVDCLHGQLKYKNWNDHCDYNYSTATYSEQLIYVVEILGKNIEI